MLISPFPKEIAFSVVGSLDLDDFELKPEEKEVIRGAKSELYRRNFCLGRAAAREALLTLGISKTSPITRAESGAPAWPKGFIGSISHKDGIGVAAVGKSEKIRMIGVDIENIDGAPLKVSHKVAHHNELSWLERRGKEGLAMLFSAKEALYKALSPIHGKFIGFKDVWLSWNEPEKVFYAHAADSEITYLFDEPIRINVERHGGLVLASIVVYN